ncbi:MAG: retroviral-like aspartic protease family protein, partial [Sedimenticola sp.]
MAGTGTWIFKLHGATSVGQQGALKRTGQSEKLGSIPCTNVTDKATLPTCNGAYIKGRIENIHIVYTVDTGATRTVLSTKVYNSLDKARRPHLIPAARLAGAGGKPLKELGKAVFTLQLGPLKLEKELIVAEIQDDCLLGMDILQNDQEGPSDVLLSQGIIVLRGVEIPVMQVGTEGQRRVVSADHFVIPGYSERIIDVYIQRDEDDDHRPDTEFIVEPTSNFQEVYGLRMARTLVDIKDRVTNQIRVLNPFPTTTSINQDAVVGMAEPRIGSIQFIVDEQSVGMQQEEATVRRIQICKQEEHDTERKVEAERTCSIQEMTNGETEVGIPHHLKELCKRATEDKPNHEANKIRKLLVKYQNAFSKNDNDLGLTSITEHCIDTGDAVPIKQPPRRVPIAYAEAERNAILELEEKGVIRKSNSPWASPIVLVKKADGKMRPCVDYRR